MKKMTSAEVRRGFLDYFEEMKHKEVASSSLVPGNDPTLLFTNAGMVQFKDVFLGMDKRPYSRAATSQKCMRVSGKHNDLENVGPSPRHHTFFEMLGNFSFGDYFKSEACRYAFDLLTKVFGLPQDRLFFTVHTSDDEAFRIWTEEIGISKDRVHRLGDKSNFWQMGETGPCGPCSEIFWDWDPSRGTDYETIAREHVEDTGRLFEVWNLVFMQFNQKPDGTREPLPKPSVDTGMGLERVVSVLQGVKTNYDTDLFMPIMERIQALNGATEEQRRADPIPYNVIADHIRAATFLIADGVVPGPKDRGSVCRMVIRRAARYGRKIGFHAPFLADVADAVIDTMGEHYRELREKREAIRKAITQEEVRFSRTLETGLARLDEMLMELPKGTALDGEKSFFLKSTLGLPFEVTRDVAREKGYEVDEAGFKAEEQQHSLASGGGQAMGVFDESQVYTTLLNELRKLGALGTDGVTYDPYSSLERNVRLLAILRDGHPVEQAEVGDRVEVVLHATPFYVEAGGQVSDTGIIRGEGWGIDIEEMRRPVGGMVVHVGEVVEGTPTVGAPGVARVDAGRRMDIMRNHTATHLLHAQLRGVLGSHVQQKGSLVAPDRLRFDFSHDAPISLEQMSILNANINEAIMANLPVNIVEKDLATARSEGAMALFGEKYGDRVRTVTILEDDDKRYSYELCGGTHVPSTAVIGTFVITGEGGVAQGVRRIEALTGHGAQQYLSRQIHILRGAASKLGTPPEHLAERVEALQQETSAVRQENARLRRQLARVEFEGLLSKIETMQGVSVLIAQVSATSPDMLREMSDWFRDKVKSGVIVLGTVNEDKPQLVAAVSDDLTKRVHAGNLIKQAAPVVGGGGGGRPNMAQAGGKDPAKLPEALHTARTFIQEALGK
ncbi:MAG: alanine--tRNA ligase [Anaerolinea sp.]|nr:alanine--tRNA ligase [Anaerolinea sp.]MCC6975349.1 alanine--tRNA ligase [Anaerolineae bacterium]CAG1010269.1 alanyl-tRNA synthetase [Anaerolineae bacterium]